MHFSLKLLLLVTAVSLQTGCAHGRIDILDQKGQIVGACTANFDWHWYGAQDSVNYLLYLCAQSHRDHGRVIADNAIFDKDYTLPAAPESESWNKSNAYQEFKAGRISVQKYGYLLAAMEYEFVLKKQRARQQFEAGLINAQEYGERVVKAQTAFTGE